MKLKKLQKLVIREVLECGLLKDKEQLHALLMDKVISMKDKTAVKYLLYLELLVALGCI